MDLSEVTEWIVCSIQSGEKSKEVYENILFQFACDIENNEEIQHVFDNAKERLEYDIENI